MDGLTDVVGGRVVDWAKVSRGVGRAFRGLSDNGCRGRGMGYGCRYGMVLVGRRTTDSSSNSIRGVLRASQRRV